MDDFNYIEIVKRSVFVFMFQPLTVDPYWQYYPAGSTHLHTMNMQPSYQPEPPVQYSGAYPIHMRGALDTTNMHHPCMYINMIDGIGHQISKCKYFYIFKILSIIVRLGL